MPTGKSRGAGSIFGISFGVLGVLMGVGLLGMAAYTALNYKAAVGTTSMLWEEAGFKDPEVVAKDSDESSSFGEEVSIVFSSAEEDESDEDESEDEYVTSDRGFEDEGSEEDSVEFQGLV